MKKLLFAGLFALLIAGCNNDARVASYNISQDADNFKINRRIVFYDAIQGKYLLSIEGKCSITKDNQDKQLEVTCKTSDNEYKKHYLGISDNVTYFAEQITSSPANVYNYKVIFKPQSIIPDVEVKMQ